MNTKANIASKSANETVDEEKKKNYVIDENQIDEIAKYYLCIGGKWYKKSLDPLTGQEELFPIIPSFIIDSQGHAYPKEIAEMVRKKAPQYLARKNHPSHVNYQECIINSIGDRFYNDYRPIGHIPHEGAWPHIERLIRHIFGNHYEMGLDYFQLLYLQPLHALPILLLVSKKTGTGKSTFCKFVNAVFGANALPLTSAILESRFNAYWTGKLIVYVEENDSDSKEERKQSNKVKLVVTADTLPTEGKGKDPRLTSNFAKVIICSNDEDTPVAIDPEDTRYWVLKVPALSKEEESVDVLDECKKEIPAFLFSLLHRQMYKQRSNRLWFSPDEIRTEAWQHIVSRSRDSFEQSLAELLMDIMDKYDLDELKYSKTELWNVVKGSSQFSDSVRRKGDDLKIKRILNRWGLEASRKNDRHDVYQLNHMGEVMPPLNLSSKIFTIKRKIIETIIK